MSSVASKVAANALFEVPLQLIPGGPWVRFEFVGFRPSVTTLRSLKSAIRRFLKTHPWGLHMKASFVALYGHAFQVSIEAREGLQYGSVRAYGSELSHLFKRSLNHLKLAPDDEWSAESVGIA